MITFFASHRTAANILMVLFAFLGLAALPSLRRETFPSFTPDQLKISVAYPGASTEDVEEAICQRIEDALDGVSYVEEIRSEAREGVGSVTVEMESGQDFPSFLAEVSSEIDSIDEFPGDAEEPLIERLGQSDHVISIAVSGPMSVSDLKAHCEDIKRRLLRIDHVAQVELRGFSDHQIRIRAHAERLLQLGLSVSELADIVARRSLDLPVGALETVDQNILIRFADLRRTPAELESLIVVSGENGATIRLAELADVSDSFELDEEKIIFDGQRAGVLVVEKTHAEDSLKVLAAVQEFVEEERRSGPPGVSLQLTEDSTSIIKDRLRLLVVNGGQGLLLVFLSLWLFFSFRLAFWVAMGLPVAFLGALFCMAQLGYSLNMITMVGLLLALGLLMDDAIVLSENIATHLQRGKKSLRAVIDGVMEVRVGVLSSFATTLCVFGPLAYLEGNIGKVLKVLPVALILVLSVSLIEAFFILPNHLSHALAKFDPTKRSRARVAFDGGLAFLRDRVVGRVADLAVSWRYLAAGLAIALFLGSIGMIAGGRLKFQAFPDLDGDSVQARILLPPGTPLPRTEEVVAQVLAALDSVSEEFDPLQPNGEKLIRHISVRFNDNPSAYEKGPHVATVAVDLLSAEDRNATVDEITARWRHHLGPLPDVLGLKFNQGSFGPAGKPLELRISGDDLRELEGAARELQAWFEGYEGVEDLSNDLRPGKSEFLIRPRDRAASLGVDALLIANQLRAAFQGQTATEMQIGAEAYEVEVILRAEDQSGVENLDDFQLHLPNGRQLPLSAVATVSQSRGWARIARIDRRRTVTVEGDIDTRVTNTADLTARYIAAEVPKLKARHPGIVFSAAGEAEESGTTRKSLLRGLLMGLVGVFLLLAFQFQDWIEPIVVLIAIPFALVGVIWGHILMGMPLTMPGMLGFVSLAGVVVNDSILLVEFIRISRREGLTISQAARKATRARFRAVLLTSLTTIAGLLPLLAERSLQAQVLIPVAISIVFGLLASTLLVLAVLPAVYTIFGDLKLLPSLD